MTFLYLILIAALFGCGSYFLLGTGNRRWIVKYIIGSPSRGAVSLDSPVHLLLCIADHFEPNWGGASSATALSRVEHWAKRYPASFEEFRDADGFPPRHTFFYPMEAYDPAQIEVLATLCRQGFGEVEIHLHHGHDTAESLSERLTSYVQCLSEQHELLGIARNTNRNAYGFVHGNWALNDSRGNPALCGVSNELETLWRTGCYADFTFPAYPSEAQPARTNSIYYARFAAGRTALDLGVEAQTGRTGPERALLLIQGPLVTNWTRRKWGILPRVENGCIQANQPAHIERLSQWLKARVQVRGRPDWFFVKLHTHGAQERNFDALLGRPMINFHRSLARFAAENRQFKIHYVTAREMLNLTRAAEAGWTGSISAARDFEIVSRCSNPGLRDALESATHLEANPF